MTYFVYIPCAGARHIPRCKICTPLTTEQETTERDSAVFVDPPAHHHKVYTLVIEDLASKSPILACVTEFLSCYNRSV